MKRKEILEQAGKCVNGERQDDYGSPENNFACIADLWSTYLANRASKGKISAVDVAAMLALLKIARIASGRGKADNWVDLAGYAACGGEIESAEATREESRGFGDS
jgi:hypothetical protein